MTNALLTLIIALLFKVLYELNIDNLYGMFYYIASITTASLAVVWSIYAVVSQYKHRNDS